MQATVALTWTKLDPPRLHCEGRGDLNDRRRHEFCAGGTGAWVSRRARWERSDGMMQCGTCKRADDETPLPWQEKPMHATVQHWSRRVTKRLTVDDGPTHADADTQIKVDAIGLDYIDNGSGLNVRAYLHGSVLRKDGTPYPKRRVTHTVWNALAEGGWLRELIDEHTPPEFLPNTLKP